MSLCEASLSSGDAHELRVAQPTILVRSTNDTSMTIFDLTHRSFVMSSAVAPSPQ